MRHGPLLPLILCAAACASSAVSQSAAPTSPPVLRNAGFESAARPGERCPVEWSCTMHSNPDSFRFALDASDPAEGARSVCVERVAPEPWAVISQFIPARDLRGRKLRFSVALRAERLEGEGAGPWVLVSGSNGMILHEERVSKLASSWERRVIEFQVPAQAEGLEVGATLQGGGRVCVDDARLEPA